MGGPDKSLRIILNKFVVDSGIQLGGLPVPGYNGDTTAVAVVTSWKISAGGRQISLSNVTADGTRFAFRLNFDSQQERSPSRTLRPRVIGPCTQLCTRAYS